MKHIIKILFLMYISCTILSGCSEDKKSESSSNFYELDYICYNDNDRQVNYDKCDSIDYAFVQNTCFDKSSRQAVSNTNCRAIRSNNTSNNWNNQNNTSCSGTYYWRNPVNPSEEVSVNCVVSQGNCRGYQLYRNSMWDNSNNSANGTFSQPVQCN